MVKYPGIKGLCKNSLIERCSEYIPFLEFGEPFNGYKTHV